MLKVLKNSRFTIIPSRKLISINSARTHTLSGSFSAESAASKRHIESEPSKSLVVTDPKVKLM